MITPEKIEEWLKEVEERPSSAYWIIRFITSRLTDLTRWNEELLAENIELRDGRKVAAYESRISSLEYQVELLKRQLGGEVTLPDAPPVPQAPVRIACILIFNALGQALRVDVDLDQATSGRAVAKLEGDLTPEGWLPRLAIAHPQEELLFAFHTGRTVTHPVEHLPISEPGKLRWQHAFCEPPVGSEELSSLLPIARMALYEGCIQTSRRGFVKKIREALLESYVNNSYIGTGTKLPADRACELTLCNFSDRLALVSREGFVLGLEINRLPAAIEETIRLGATDHIINACAVQQQPAFVFVTDGGKVIHREADWVEISSSFKSRGQAVFSQERRNAGTRLAGAGAVTPEDWGVALRRNGQLSLHKIGELIEAGTLPTGPEVIAFTTFHLQENR